MRTSTRPLPTSVAAAPMSASAKQFTPPPRTPRRKASAMVKLTGRRLRFLAGTLAVTALTAAALLAAVAVDADEHAAPQPGALFLQMVPVLQHPRCINCHPRGDFPRQGD